MSRIQEDLPVLFTEVDLRVCELQNIVFHYIRLLEGTQ